MAREIKFRAWDMENNRMMSLFDCYDIFGRQLRSTNGKYPLMQFTGLHDKNGKEIYEGDILDVAEWCNGCSASIPHAVEWGVLSDSDEYNATEYLCWKTGRSSLIDTAPLSSIIGNIYENPELLTESNASSAPKG